MRDSGSGSKYAGEMIREYVQFVKLSLFEKQHHIVVLRLYRPKLQMRQMAKMI
jgi:hypothetical protein